MIQDIKSVVWKEMTELIHIIAGTRAQWIGLTVFFGIFGVFMPLQMGDSIEKYPVVMFVFSFMPLFIVMQIVADSFAGERERHTLETMLATRLPDKAILFGKITTIVLYGWGMSMLIFIIMLISVNIIHGDEKLILPPLMIAAANVVASILVAVFATSIGIFISLRAATVKQAQQTIGLIMMSIWFLPVFGVPIISKYIPKESMKPVEGMLKNLGIEMFLVILIGGIFLVDIAFIKILTKRFKRERLILD
jgi:ABC-2 type transport system permease protein